MKEDATDGEKKRRRESVFRDAYVRRAHPDLIPAETRTRRCDHSARAEGPVVVAHALIALSNYTRPNRDIYLTTRHSPWSRRLSQRDVNSLTFNCATWAGRARTANTYAAARLRERRHVACTCTELSDEPIPSGSQGYPMQLI